MLTTEQITFFQEHGYLILKNLIDPEVIEGLAGTGLAAF